jgi:CheY-like chemotaxis protein
MSLKSWHVLVVEDEADSMELVRGILEYHNITTSGAPTAEEALEILEDTLPTLIIIDLALPKMDGWGLLNELQNNERYSSITRVAITAYHTPTLANEAIEAGFDAYFAKPIDATSFVRELQGIVEDNGV